MDNLSFWAELQQLAQQRYPELSPEEACIEFHRDVFKCPEQVTRVLQLILSSLAGQSPQIAEAFGNLYNNPRVIFLAQAIRIAGQVFDETSPKDPQLIADSLTEEANDISSPMATEILRRLASATANSANSSSRSAETVAESASFLGAR
ncbi:hypothetical protein Plec18170_003572 [Paecilomyces lecythidis]